MSSLSCRALVVCALACAISACTEGAGYVVSAPSGVTTESGNQATFTIALRSEPTADVVVHFVSSDTTEGTLAASSLTFTTGDWSTPQSVVITGADDSEADGDKAYDIVFTATTSTDEDYAASVPPSVSLTNEDDDDPGVTTGSPSGATTERGGQASFTVVLDSRPTASVQLALATSNGAEGTPDKTALTFTVDNWNAPQLVTVTGVDDDRADGEATYEITFAPLASDDARYAGLTPAPVVLHNTDDESAGFTVSEPSGHTSEAGGRATFTIALSSAPRADVTVRPVSSDEGEGRVERDSLTFTTTNWNAPQTVTVIGVDDTLADGNQRFTVTFGATSSDDAYDAVAPVSIELANDDDDTPGFVIGAAAGAATEAGGQVSFGLSLATQPRAPVELGFAVDDDGEATLDIAALVFTPENWDAPQTVTATGVDDALADGDQRFHVVFVEATSDDADYQGRKPNAVELTNADDDTAGFVVSEPTGNTTERGAGASFTLALSSEPVADVTLTFVSSDTTEGRLLVERLVFTAENWDAPQTVRVVGVDDSLADGEQHYSVVFSATTSEDPRYAVLVPPSVLFGNVDDETAGFVVSAVRGTVTEEGGQGTFTVALTAEPIADVTVSFDSDDETEGAVSPKTLTFTRASWSAPQVVTVTGVDDDAIDGAQPFHITFGATTTEDIGYVALVPPAVDVVNVDDDTAGVLFGEVSGPTTEAGGQATFTIRLASVPTADVVLAFTSSDAAEGKAVETQLTFTPENWNAPQTVTVTGQDDAVADGNRPYFIVFSPFSGADSNYAGVVVPRFALTNTDNDSPGFVISAPAGQVTEAGGQAAFSVKLTSKPVADVVVRFFSNDVSEGVIPVQSLTFTPANWNAAQSVIVTGVDDALADGAQSFSIVFTATTSTDPLYAALVPPRVDLSTADNDSAGITVGTVVGNATEAGGAASFTVVLNSQPTADVVVVVSVSDTTEGRLATTRYTFTPRNWNAPQTVVVSGVDDNLVDGTQAFTVRFSPTESTDPGYSGRVPPNVNVSTLDNDSAGLVVTAPSGPTRETGATTATFTVRLATQPSANVVVTLVSSNPSEGVISPATLTFTNANWNTPQTVTATGQNDDLADGTQAYAVVFGAVTSTDPTYAGLVAPRLDLANVDDDSAGLTIGAPSGSTTEVGGTATFTLRLNSRPTADVVYYLVSTNTAEGVLSPATLTFTTANWATPQTVTVTGVDDLVDDGNQPWAVAVQSIRTTDPAYAVLYPANVVITNVDNDTAAISVSAASGNTTEGGGYVTFSIVLGSQPTANVTVNFASNDTTEGVTNVSSVTFTTANWNVAQQVRITGVDDAIVDGNITYAIVFSATTSADATYAALRPGNVTLSNIDDDPRCQRIGWKTGSASWACPAGYRMPTTAELGLVSACFIASDTTKFGYYYDVATVVGGCNCKWNAAWCGQPSIETIRGGRMCGDYEQLHICVR